MSFLLPLGSFSLPFPLLVPLLVACLLSVCLLPVFAPTSRCVCICWTTFRSWFSPLMILVLGTDLGLSGSAAGTLTHWGISPGPRSPLDSFLDGCECRMWNDPNCPAERVPFPWLLFLHAQFPHCGLMGLVLECLLSSLPPVGLLISWGLLSWVLWYNPVASVLGRQRVEDQEFKAIPCI